MFVESPTDMKSKLRPGATSSEDAAPPGLEDSMAQGTTNMSLWSFFSPQNISTFFMRGV
jgi:hypothetical protein